MILPVSVVADDYVQLFILCFFDREHSTQVDFVARVLGWGDGYYKGPKESENADLRATEKDCREEDQLMRRKVLRELQALVCTGEEDSTTSAGLDYVTDTEWFYLVSMSYFFSHGVG